jgi:hypothetical protein
MDREGPQGIPRYQLEESFSGFRYKKIDSDAHPEPSAVVITAAGRGLDWDS